MRSHFSSSQLFFPLIVLVLVGCASAPPVQYNEAKNQGTWQAKVQVRDLKTNKSNILSMEVISEKNQAMRMELTGTLGARVASLLMKDQGISYAVHTQKKYYSGSVTEKSLLPLLKVELDPRWLYSVFFDQALQGSGWKCSNDNKNLVEKCEQAKTNYSILWSERQGENKRVVIQGADFEINVLVKDFSTKVQSPEKAFSLEAPANYKRYKLL
jgi:hypothetical protein